MIVFVIWSSDRDQVESIMGKVEPSSGPRRPRAKRELITSELHRVTRLLGGVKLELDFWTRDSCGALHRIHARDLHSPLGDAEEVLARPYLT